MKTLSIQNQRLAVVVSFLIMFQPLMCFVFAQQNQAVFINPAMKVTNLRTTTEQPMRLDKLSVDIKIIGQVAITTLDMTYYNNNSRVMEGEFNFPLADGQTISRFALDINGVLREGVVVEKEKGRKTFEAIVRRGVDPGLLEMTKGNNFKMRIYPLPAKGTRRVVVAFEQELTDKGSSDLYLLPLKITEPIASFSVHAEVIKNTVRVDNEQNELTDLLFNKMNDSYVANFERTNFMPDKKIALSFPHVNNTEKIFTANLNNNSDSSYFYINFRPKQLQQVKVLPRRITLLWDKSHSAQARNLTKELAVLEAYFRKIGNLTVELVSFNIKAANSEVFEISNGNWTALKSALETMFYDGGTSLGCLDFTKYKSDEILLFSDGVSTFGGNEPKLSQTPVYTLNSGLSADLAYLTYIAQHNGGLYIDLNKLTNEEVLTKLTGNNYQFISAQIVSGNVSDIYPSKPCQFNNTFSAAGVMKGKSAKLILNFGFGSTISYSKTIVLDADNSTDSGILSRLWAEKKIAELTLNEDKNKDEIALTGKKFGIVTSNTSLIVLETLNDYLQNDIVPPADMQEDYFRRKMSREKNASDNVARQIDHVVWLSDEQSKWWNTAYVVNPVKPSTQFHKPVIKRDEEVNEDNELKSQEELNVTGSAISIADVKGNDEMIGVDIADVKIAITQESGADEIIAPVRTLPTPKSSIELNAWDPQTPYLKVLQYAVVGTEYATYQKLKAEYGTTPSFYADVADYFAKLGKKDTAVTVLSNMAELKLESPQLLRVMGSKLIELKCRAEAIKVFETVLKLKAEEPQSYRDLGLAYASNGELQKAIEILYEVVKQNWDGRFSGIQLIVMNEINNIVSTHPNLNSGFIDKRLLKNEPVNIRVVLSWDTDNCDMDLWVTDPNGEKCYYQNKLTHTGGKISNDFTNGYGPEEFMVKKAINGKYLVQANYFGTRSQAQLAPVNLRLLFITNFGKVNQKQKEVVIRLESNKDIIDVGKFSFTDN